MEAEDVSAETLTPSEAWTIWASEHRCAICDSPAVRVSHEMIEEHRALRPAYRHMAMVPHAVEPWMTDVVASEWDTEVECENNHVMRGRHMKVHE